MTQYGVLHEGNAYRVYATEDGITKRPFGPRFGGPFLAGQYADLSAGRPISPLRASRRTEEPVASPPAALGAPPLSVSRPDVGVVTATSHRSRATG